MEDQIMEIMKRASIFMILAQAVIHFRPNPSYEKYFKFLAGIMTVVILIIPVMELVRSGIGEEYETYVEEFAKRMEEVWEEEFTVDMTPSQSYLRTMENEIRTKLNHDVILEGYAVETVTILGLSEGGESGPGEDYKIKIYLTPDDAGIRAVRVDKISIEEDSPEEETDAAEDGRRKAAQKKAAELLEIEADKVEVEIGA